MHVCFGGESASWCTYMYIVDAAQLPCGCRHCWCCCLPLPQVVQVYTYYLTPLLLQQNGLRVGPSSSPHAMPGMSGAGAAAAAAEPDDGDGSNVFGWSLRLVMEWMEQVG